MQLKTKIWLLLGAVVAIMLLADVALSYRDMQSELIDEMRGDAQELHAMMMATRRVHHKALLEKDKAPDKLATDSLPAHSMTLIAEEFASLSSSGITFNNVSVAPRRPENLADQQEMKAIEWFRSNPDAKERLERINSGENGNFFHYTAPLRANTFCLQCHGDPEDAPEVVRSNYNTSFGFKEGDLLGIASIKIPVKKLDNHFLHIWQADIFKSVIGYTIFFIVLGLLLDRFILNRLIKLQTGAEKIAAGDYQARVTPTGDDELTALADSFNRMAGTVQDEIVTLIQAEQRLKENHDRLTAFMEALPDVVIVKDGKGNWLLTNHVARSIFQVENYPWKHKSDLDLATDRPQLQATHIQCHRNDETAWQKGEMTLFTEELIDVEGLPHTFEVRKMPLFHSNGKRSAMMVIGRDVTNRIAIEKDLRKLSRVIEQSPESIVITDLEGTIEYVNSTFTSNTGYSKKEAVGKNPRILKSGKTPAETFVEMWDTLLKGKIWKGELINRRKDGSEFHENAIIAPVRESDGRVTHYAAIKQDITAQKQTAEQLHRLASFDPLTELPNRSLLLDRMEQLISAGQRSPETSALILINIDRFKTINNARGIGTGDALLKGLGQRISASLRTGDTLARLSADEFALLLPNMGKQNSQTSWDTLAVAEKIQSALSQPFIAEQESITITASLGITLFPESQEDNPENILKRANTALHRAKESGGNQSSFFETDMRDKAEQRFRVERELRKAIEEDELEIYLQPQVDGEGARIGAEALVRWNHPERGLVPPGLFIPIAEESNLIIELDSWVVAKVCEMLADQNTVGTPLHISVNLSPRHFQQRGFVPWMRDLLLATGADPTRLTIEVTEGLLIDNINDAIVKMNDLSELGIHFSLDDFGTGHSSLSYLKRLPIHELKIDKMFVQDAPHDPDDAALVNTILAVAEHLHLRVVVEGVETDQQFNFFEGRPDIIYQGYLFGKPKPATEWIAKWQTESTRS